MRCFIPLFFYSQYVLTDLFYFILLFFKSLCHNFFFFFFAMKKIECLFCQKNRKKKYNAWHLNGEIPLNKYLIAFKHGFYAYFSSLDRFLFNSLQLSFIYGMKQFSEEHKMSFSFLEAPDNLWYVCCMSNKKIPRFLLP